MLIRKVFKSKKKKEMVAQVTSTPNGSEEIQDSLDVSIIEPDQESLEELEGEFLEKIQIIDVTACPGVSVVQHPVHCVLPCNMGSEPNSRLRLRLPIGQQSNSQITNSSYLQRLALELQKSVDTINKESSKPDDISSTPNFTDCSKTTRDPGLREEAGTIGKCSSPFRHNFALQTIQKFSQQTSPFQVSNISGDKTTSSEIPKPARSISSQSYPGTPRRNISRLNSHPRSRSESPPCGKDEIIKDQKRITSTLKKIMSKTASNFTNEQPKLPEAPCAQSTQSRPPSKRNVHFNQKLITVEDSSTGVVQELYFNKDMKTGDPSTQTIGVPSLHGPHCFEELPCSHPCPLKNVCIPCQTFKQDGSLSYPLGLPRLSKLACPIPDSSLTCPHENALEIQSELTCSCPPSCKCKARPTSPPCSCRSATPPRCNSLKPASPTQPRRPQPPCPPQPCILQSCQTQDLCKQDTGMSGTDSVCSLTSTSGMCDAKRAQYLQNKLSAIQQCLRNKEETIRVQAESLTCAEQRIAMLTIRSTQQRRELDTCNRELCKLRETGACKSEDQLKQTRPKDDSRYKMDVCCILSEPFCSRTAQCCQSSNTEVQNQKNMVVALQNNLTVIEDLYRQCFYETAKQEELIENLRKSYLDVRLMEKEKADRIGRLENVVNAQKRSLETCQDVVIEVENLKLEILNFLNTSNNDSGMWEQSLAGEVGEDINDIMVQLHQLRELLQGESMETCTLKRENENLRKLTGELECKIEELCRQKSQLECAVCEKEDTITCVRKENDELCCAMRCLRSEIDATKKRVCELQNENECVRKQLKQAQEEVGETKSEICCLRDHNCELQQKNECLTEDLQRADEIIKENCKVRSEVSYLAQQVALWRRQLADSEERVRSVEAELARARTHCRNVDHCYREKVEAVAALEVQLQEAHARGAQLCAESRRVVGAVRNWIRRMQATNAEQCQKIQAQESFIAMLQRALQDRIQDQHSNCLPVTCAAVDPCEPPQIECFSNYRAIVSGQIPFGCCTKCTAKRSNDEETVSMQVSCSKCSKRPNDSSRSPVDDIDVLQVECAKYAPKRPNDTSRSLTDDSGDVTQVGCCKCPPQRKNAVTSSKDLKTDIPLDFKIGCSKCAPKRKTKRIDKTEEPAASSQLVAKACDCVREEVAPQATDAQGHAGDTPSCSHIPVRSCKLLREKMYHDRVTHFLRCTAGEPRGEVGVQEPVRAHQATSPAPLLSPAPLAPPAPGHSHGHGASRIPRAVSPADELLERVTRLGDAMEESQRRWSRAKLPQPQREHT